VVEKIPRFSGGAGLQNSCAKRKVKKLLALTSPRSRAILGLLDFLVDIGVPAEKEVIQ
jgi:hypothetical protein